MTMQYIHVHVILSFSSTPEESLKATLRETVVNIINDFLQPDYFGLIPRSP